MKYHNHWRFGHGTPRDMSKLSPVIIYTSQMGVTYTTSVVQRNFMMPMCVVIFDRDATFKCRRFNLFSPSCLTIATESL
jgi:hypothetical protein